MAFLHFDYTLRAGKTMPSKGARSQDTRVRVHGAIYGVYSNTGQSIGLPISLPRPGGLEGGGGRSRAASPDPGRAVGNPIDCPVLELTPGTAVEDSTTHSAVV